MQRQANERAGFNGNGPEKLKHIMSRRDAVIVPGVANALFARVVEDLGYEALYVTGAGIANMHLGAPDIGLVTLTEVASIVSVISDAVSLPIIVDADTGAGADVIFVEAPLNEAEMARIGREIKAPHIANIVFGGLTPEIPRERLKDMGFSVALYANAALQAALKSVREVLDVLQKEGSLVSVRDRLASFEERQRSVDKDRYDALEKRYAVGA